MIDFSKSWAIRKSDKTPLVDQLENNIRWSIFTGEIRYTEKLPPIRLLAQDLGVGVNTVRSAYKKLEEQSLVVTKPHIGTVVQMESADPKNVRSELVVSIKSALQNGLSPEDIKAIVETTLAENRRAHKRRILFVYSDPIVGHRYSEQIAREVGVLVQQVSIDHLQQTIDQYQQIEDLDAVVTTYFNYAKVLQICPGLKGILCGMTVEISKEVTDTLDSLPVGSKVILLSRKDESAEGFINLVNKNYPHLLIGNYHETEEGHWSELSEGADAVFVSPCLLPKVLNCELNVPLFEIWNKLNAQSVQKLKEHLH